MRVLVALSISAIPASALGFLVYIAPAIPLSALGVCLGFVPSWKARYSWLRKLGRISVVINAAILILAVVIVIDTNRIY
jgi:hypothetical protein